MGIESPEAAASARPEAPIVLSDEAFSELQDDLSRPGQVDERLREALSRPPKFNLVD
jgi:hypothetical protein